MMQRQGELTVEAMCELTDIARSGYYRFLRERTEAVQDGPPASTGAGGEP